MRYSDLEAWLPGQLEALGYGVPTKPMPVFHPGPNTVAQLQKKSTQALVFLQISNGSPSTTEDLLDRPFINVRVIGRQNDYLSAESLAYDIDTIFRRVQNETVGSVKAKYIAQTGGVPQMVDYDTADRWHYQNTYITETKSGVYDA